LRNATKAAPIVVMKERPFSLPLARGGGAYSRRRGLIKPPRNFVAVPLAKGGKIGFALSGALFTPPFPEFCIAGNLGMSHFFHYGAGLDYKLSCRVV
jgi:hypothetical protein